MEDRSTHPYENAASKANFFSGLSTWRWAISCPASASSRKGRPTLITRRVAVLRFGFKPATFAGNGPRDSREFVGQRTGDDIGCSSAHQRAHPFRKGTSLAMYVQYIRMRT